MNLPTTTTRFTAAALAWPLLVTLVGAQQNSIVNTRHNLSVSGPGAIRAATETQVCVFCHAPHNSRIQAPLWNREDSRTTYLTYQSSTFRGTVAQPNGTTRLCLSCHDGTIALGKVVSLGQEIEMAGGNRFLSSGAGYIGTSLMDDHPVSFAYATSRGGSGVDFLPASAIHSPARLDDGGQVQCTSCHDAHDNTLGDFLLLTDRRSELCLACHMPRGWATATHATTPATWNGSGNNPWPDAHYQSVAENGCRSCHRPHAAGSPQRLLNFAVEEENCLRCHNGNVAAKDVRGDLGKPSAHSPLAYQGVHDAAENPLTMARHAECQDCHNPHAATATPAAPPGVPGALAGASGVDSGGSPVAQIRFGYELCYKCHADNNGALIRIPRVVDQANVRLEFSPANPSFHPIEAPGRSASVPSLLPPWTTASVMACTDCHQSDTSPAFGGTGPAGPHGSVFTPLLGRNYDTRDNVAESPTAYALCYKCHSRSSILGNASFKEHNKHIVEEKSACSTCHDPHGIAATQGTPQNNAHLINFDRRIVRPARSGRLEYLSLGNRTGSCTLLCHGENHEAERY